MKTLTAALLGITLLASSTANAAIEVAHETVIWAPSQANVDYIGDVACTPLPSSCTATFCQEWYLTEDSSALVCLDTDELFTAGHWTLDIGPDQNDLQATVEY